MGHFNEQCFKFEHEMESVMTYYSGM